MVRTSWWILTFIVLVFGGTSAFAAPAFIGVKKCKKCRCQWMGSWWAVKLNEERRMDDPRDRSLGYLLTEQYRVTSPKKGRKKKKE